MTIIIIIKACYIGVTQKKNNDYNKNYSYESKKKIIIKKNAIDNINNKYKFHKLRLK